MDAKVSKKDDTLSLISKKVKTNTASQPDDAYDSYEDNTNEQVNEGKPESLVVSKATEKKKKGLADILITGTVAKVVIPDVAKKVNKTSKQGDSAKPKFTNSKGDVGIKQVDPKTIAARPVK